MKKAILLSAFCAAVFSLSAQTKFGVTSGLVLASISTDDADLKSEKATLLAPQVGLIIDHALSSSLSLQSQFILIQKGTAVKHDGHKDKIRFTALDIPLQLMYRTKSGWFIGGGPNLGINLSAQNIDDEGEEKLSFDDYQRYDMGLNFRTGVELKNGFVFSLNKLFGLTDVKNATNFRWNNNAIGINVGYMFQPKKKK